MYEKEFTICGPPAIKESELVKDNQLVTNVGDFEDVCDRQTYHFPKVLQKWGKWLEGALKEKKRVSPSRG
jgi:hypothetical protein